MKGENIIKTLVVCVDGKDGRTVASCLGSDGEVVRGKARCVEGDEFKVEIGAIIALCKALGVSPAKACFDVMNVYAKDSAAAVERAKAKETETHVKNVKAKAKVKAKVKVSNVKVTANDLKGVPVGKVKRGHCVLKPVGIFKVKGVEDNTVDYGVMGTPTVFTDKDGRALFVGDLVTVDVIEGDVRTGRHWRALPGLAFVVDERSDNPVSKGKYIMGMMSACNDKTGKIDKRFRVKKVKNWTEVEIGEINSNGQLRPEWEDEV